jgi:hypothetical protein
VSWLAEIGMMPARLTRPTVGLSPTSPQMEAGHTTEPSVSVPMVMVARLAAAAAPDPELEPHGLRSSAYGLCVCPPRALHPLVDFVERKLAHSLRFVLPRTTAPASRSRETTKASRAGAGAPTSASDPAVVIIRSAVSMLSFTSTGTPCSGPRTRPAARSRSRSAAIATASGFTSMTALRAGPRRSTSSMRAR